MGYKEEFDKNYRDAINHLEDLVTEHEVQNLYVEEGCTALARLIDKMDADNWESIAEQMREIVANIEWRLK